MVSSSTPARQRLTLTHWLILVIAAIGFAFDTYELLVMPLIARPALMELGRLQPGTPEFGRWFALLFYVPAAAGGVFGLLGGYLTDRLGRRRVLTWSILLYALSAFAAGFSTSLPMLLVLRCTTFVGVCVEFVAAVAWLAELFSEPHQRERVLGYTQAFSSIGGLLVAGANSLAIAWAARLPAVGMPAALAGWLGTVAAPHAAWRYTIMSGLIPALPLIIVRPFLPESPVWRERKAGGRLRRPSIRELFTPAFRRTTIVSTIVAACGFGAAFGAIQQIPQIVPGLPEVRARGEGRSPPEQALVSQAYAANLTKVQEVGGLVGRVALAILALRMVSRRALLRVFQVPGLVLMPLVFAFAFDENRISLLTLDLNRAGLGVWHVTLLDVGVFLAGVVTVAQFSFWGNYLPLVYPVHLRGTGESFAANIGGRLIGTSFAAVTGLLAVQAFVPGNLPPVKVAYAAAGVAFFVYLVGLVAGFFLPQPRAAILKE